MTITIKEVYEQLPKECLAVSEARIKINGENGLILGIYTEECKTGYVIAIVNGSIKAYRDYTEVEWIGNQPKKKMLYPCWVNYEADRGINDYPMASLLAFETEEIAHKYCSDREGVSVLKWNPEDQYPPIEIEEEG